MPSTGPCSPSTSVRTRGHQSRRSDEDKAEMREHWIDLISLMAGLPPVAEEVGDAKWISVDQRRDLAFASYVGRLFGAIEAQSLELRQFADPITSFLSDTDQGLRVGRHVLRATPTEARIVVEMLAGSADELELVPWGGLDPVVDPLRDPDELALTRQRFVRAFLVHALGSAMDPLGVPSAWQP